MKLRIMYLSMAVFVLFVGITFAWMDFSNDIEGNVIKYQYGGDSKYYMGVANTNFDATLCIADENGDYKTVTEGNPFKFTSLVPSELIYFKFEFTNDSVDEVIGDEAGAPIKVNVYLTGITANKNNDDGQPKLSEVLYFSVTGSEGYASDSVNRPTSKLVKLQDMLIPEEKENENDEQTYKVMLLENLVIPVESADEKLTGHDVGVFCYFLFDREATIEYENCDLKFENILVVIAQ